MIKQSDVTIIIPHLGTTKEQRYSRDFCLKSLDKTAPGIKQIVVTNGTLHAEFDGYMHIADQGQCKAVNAAAATVSTSWIMVSNDDMMYAPGWFEKLVAPISDETTPNIQCISPILVEPQDGAPTFVKFFAGGAGGDFDEEKWLYFAANYNSMYQDPSIITPEGLCRSGFNLPFLIKKDLWDLIGGYDVNYDPWSSNSDSDLEYKIKLAGVQPRQNTNCPVYHFSQTSGTFEPKNRPAWEKNWQYFIDKWGFPRTDDGIWEATFDIPTKEQGRKFQPWWEGFYSK